MKTIIQIHENLDIKISDHNKFKDRDQEIESNRNRDLKQLNQKLLLDHRQIEAKNQGDLTINQNF